MTLGKPKIYIWRNVTESWSHGSTTQEKYLKPKMSFIDNWATAEMELTPQERRHKLRLERDGDHCKIDDNSYHPQARTDCKSSVHIFLKLVDRTRKLRKNINICINRYLLLVWVGIVDLAIIPSWDEMKRWFLKNRMPERQIEGTQAHDLWRTLSTSGLTNSATGNCLHDCIVWYSYDELDTFLINDVSKEDPCTLGNG